MVEVHGGDLSQVVVLTGPHQDTEVGGIYHSEQLTTPPPPVVIVLLHHDHHHYTMTTTTIL